MLRLDHLVVSGETLEAASAAVEEALGVPLQPGGAHDVFFTHNRLLGLADGLYLEAIAINPAAPVPDRPRWYDLDRFHGAPRLSNWACACDDLEAARTMVPDGTGAPVSIQRGDLRWRMAVPETGILPYDNISPGLLQWQGDLHPAAMLRDQGCALRRLVVSHPQAAALAAVLRLQEPMVVFEPGPAGLLAEIDTPHGLRLLR